MRWLAVALPLLLAGCQKDPSGGAATPPPKKRPSPCTRLFERHETCHLAIADARDKFVAECAAGKKTELYQDYLACESMETCDEFVACAGAIRDRIAKRDREKRLKADLASLQKLVDEKRYTDAMKPCAIAAGAAAEALKPLCDRAAAEGSRALEEALTRQRDQSDATDWLARCLDLKELAKRAGDEAFARAELLCREVPMSARVKKALDAAREGVAAKSSRIPPECEAARTELAKLDSPWSRAQASAVNKACFSELTGSATDVLVAELTALRDKGSGDGVASRCTTLRQLAKGGPTEASSDTLCREAELAAQATATEGEVRALIAAGKDNAPFSCDQVGKKLAELGTEFAKARATTLAHVCWIELGRTVLPRKVPGMKGVCDFPVQKVYDAMKRLHLQDAELDPWLARASGLCEHK